ncbi:ParA family protein [Actinomadura sp. NPDC048955]|uniref:ParA family protein n=1 Tax=Actinomadura sp. NPDC048955 TaxID=3158228 RepID=UPI0034050FF1
MVPGPKGRPESGGPFDFIPSPSRDLRKILPQLAEGYDVVVIDSPPIEDHQGIAISALRVAVVPVMPTTSEVDRMAPKLAVIADIEPLRAEPLTVCVLLNRTVANAASTGQAVDALTAQGYHLLKTQVPRVELYAQAHGAPVTAAGTAYADAATELLEVSGEAR